MFLYWHKLTQIANLHFKLKKNSDENRRYRYRDYKNQKASIYKNEVVIEKHNHKLLIRHNLNRNQQLMYAYKLKIRNENQGRIIMP